MSRHMKPKKSEMEYNIQSVSWGKTRKIGIVFFTRSPNLWTIVPAQSYARILNAYLLSGGSIWASLEFSCRF